MYAQEESMFNVSKKQLNVQSVFKVQNNDIKTTSYRQELENHDKNSEHLQQY